jgi:Tn3 transposase DDE domain
MTRALHSIAADGFGDAVNAEGIATLSPYQTEHINRFGNYVPVPAPLPFALPQRQQARR